MFYSFMYTTGCAHLTNYELYSSSLFISLHEDKNVQEKNLHFISQISGVVNDMCHKKYTSLVNTLKLNNLSLLKATIYMLYNNSGSEILSVFKMYIQFSFCQPPTIPHDCCSFLMLGKYKCLHQFMLYSVTHYSQSAHPSEIKKQHLTTSY
jgi:hypothetical protein